MKGILSGRGRRILHCTPWALAALLVLSGCASRKHERPVATFTTEDWKYGKQPAFKLVTEHYEIYTTLQDPVLRDALPDFVEAAYEHYVQMLPPAHPPAAKMKVFLLATRGQFEAITKSYTGERAEVFLKIRNGGYSENGVSVIEYVSHAVTFPLFGHEGFHQYVFCCVNTEIPAWLNEGLAVCCEGQRWGEVRLSRFDPWCNPHRFNDLAEAAADGRLHPLSRILTTNAGEIVGGSSKSVATYYGQVWTLVLFLREGEKGKYAAGFDRLMAALKDLRAAQFARAAHIGAADRESYNLGEDLFRSFITTDLDGFEREYRAFLRERLLGAAPLKGPLR